MNEQFKFTSSDVINEMFQFIFCYFVSEFAKSGVWDIKQKSLTVWTCYGFFFVWTSREQCSCIWSHDITQIRIREYAFIHTHHIQTYIYTHKLHIQTLTDTHRYTQTQTDTLKHTQKHKQTFTYTHITHTHSDKHRHTKTQTDTDTQTSDSICTHKHRI